MINNTILVVRVTQILKDEGWIFIDNGTNQIQYASNKILGETVYFDGASELEDWINEKAKILL